MVESIIHCEMRFLEVAEKKIGLEMVEPIILWEPVPPWQQQPISGSRILRYQFIAIVKRFFCFITNFRFLRFYFYHIQSDFDSSRGFFLI